jgi:iron complex outermembrane receptor protein
VPSLLLAGGYERYDPSDSIFPEGAGPDQDRTLFTLAAQDEIFLWKERIVLVPAVRWEWLQDDFSGALPPQVAGAEPPRSRTDDYISPRLGVQLDVLPRLTVLGNIGRVFRPPNFTELFGARGVVVGTSDLDAEKAFNRDIGFRYSHEQLGILDELRLEHSYFDNAVDDLIVLVPVSVNVLRPQNIDARIRGHEIVLFVRALRHVALTANYTHQHATDESGESTDGNRLPGRADDEAYFRAELYAERGRIYFDVNLIGDYFLDRSETRFSRVPARQLYGVGVSVKPFDRKFTLTFEAKNLTDDRTQDFAGFPLPGRSFFGTVQYGF